MKKVILEGKFVSNERGFGFVELNNEEKDIFIPPTLTNGSMTGDLVKVELQKEAENGNRAEGKIIEIVKRNTIMIVGTYQKSRNYGFVVPDDIKLGTDIFISKSHNRKAKNGDKVVVKIVKYPENGKSAEGQIVEILGKSSDTNVDLISVVRAHNYKLMFPKEVEKEAKNLPEVIHGIEGRVDLREEEIFTIDGDDTKDIDDAISLTKKGNNYLLGVHIADVSHYVRPNTALDKEAIKRSTSVYLIDTVIPMLPKKLSNGICSLNPGEDRYALSIEMEIDTNGQVINSKVFKSVIKSKLQMTYHKVYDILENNIEYEDYKPHMKTLRLMKELAEILIAKKDKDGAIDFNMPEAKIILDENDAVIDIGLREMTIANRIIEEFMIIANETIAETFFQKELPFIYRVHEKPEIDRIDKLNVLLKNLNYDEIDKIDNKNLKRISEMAKGKEEEKLVSLMLLRTMQLAKYSNENIGHFGLASKYYCHFTSPIRRYPDLFIHRVISDYLAHELDKKKLTKYKRQSAKYAEISSEMEQEEEDAERELYEMKKCEYMQKHIGDEYEGTVSGVTAFGVFVELENTVEGLSRVEEMRDDYYVFDDKNMKLIGKHTGREFKLGDKVKVKCIAANKLLRRIDFEII
ncbi:MAG: ribonuclease R [Clostridia bacterium]|nr:ribonuclease R [Clostridia bacterium]